MESRTQSAARKQASAANDGSKTKRGAGQQDRAKPSKASSSSASIPNIDASGLSPADRQALAQLRKMALNTSKNAKDSHRLNVRKRSATIMEHEHQSADEEETQPRMRKKKAVAVLDSEPAEDEDDMDVDHEGEEDDIAEDGDSADVSQEARKSGKSGEVQSQSKALPKPQPKPRFRASGKGHPQSPGKAAKKATNLDDEEASVAQSLSKMAPSKAKGKARPTTVRSNDEGSDADADGHPQATTQAAKTAQQAVSSSSTKNKSRGGGTSSQATAKGTRKNIARVVSKAKSTMDSGASDLDKSDDERDTEFSAEEVDADNGELEDDDKYVEKGEESSENGDEDRDDADDNDNDVVVLRDETTQKGKPRRSKSTGNKRAKITDLPINLRALVTTSQNCLRLRIALNTAWTAEHSIQSSRLPSRNQIIYDSVHDAYEMRDKHGRHIKALRSGFAMIKKRDRKDKTHKDEKEEVEEEAKRAELQKAVYDVVWACASQFFNELKKKAKAVVETLYGLHGLSAEQRSRAAAWLLKAHPTQVNDGTGSRNIPNFVFSDINIVFNDRKQLDVTHWALGARADANLHAAMEQFSQVPDNLIAVVCNAIENTLIDIMNHSQSNFFQNKQFAAKWDGLMAILETLKEELPEYYDETKQVLWGHISGRLNLNVFEETEPDAKGTSFLKFDRMRAKLDTRVTSPSPSVSRVIAEIMFKAKSTNANANTAKPSSSKGQPPRSTNANADADAAKPPSSKGQPASMTKTAKTASKSANAKHVEQDPVDDNSQTVGTSSSKPSAVQDGMEDSEREEAQEDEIDEEEGP
ncbi:uncharacterized protein B0H18DRAFT_959597 [Fomitopsis serialis]|uniref:uncharacterized protein n=1 Tax=Fomitopsis serialis TaxID=139415 RepID=UPI00200874B8|nr:uncharacterized protein B0H18DRAFT_959597 [Neoantrodia serialis]KAH9914861.1 hypothetical protein B0H18DRAFT_959597 [Neoantrodia serialis]